MSTLQQRVPRTFARPVLAALTIGLVFVLAPTGGARETTTAKEMRDAATAFLATLDAGQKTATTFPFTSDERENWFFTPVPRKGLAYFSMTDAQRAAAVKLLKTGLSAKGFAKVEAIRSLESVLYEVEGDAGKKPFVGGDGHPHRYPERYLFTIFGTPSRHRAVGLALRRAPHLAELDGRERRGDRVEPAVLRQQPGRGPHRARRPACASSPPKRISPARCCSRSTRRSARRRWSTRRRRTTSSRRTSTRPSGCPTSASPTAP